MSAESTTTAPASAAPAAATTAASTPASSSSGTGKSSVSDKYFSSAPGSFLTLSLGRVHYRLLSPSQPPAEPLPLVVALHGINAEGDAWLRLAETLLPHGFQVLLPDF